MGWKDLLLGVGICFTGFFNSKVSMPHYRKSRKMQQASVFPLRVTEASQIQAGDPSK